MESNATLRNFTDESEWLKWRQLGIGGSDAPIIMGVSKFKTPFELFLEKTGRKRQPPKNKAMAHGVANEAKARDAYTLETGNFMPPANVDAGGFLHASLDGYDPETKTILEVKAPWDITDHISAKEGHVPDHYFPQLQHCLAVAGAATAHYFSWFGEGDQILLEIPFDEDYWTKELYPREREFWEWVTSGQYPIPKGEEVRDDPEYLAVEREIWAALAMREVANERMRLAKAKIQRLIKAEVTRGEKLEATWTYRKAGVVKAFNRAESLILTFRRIS